MKQIKWAELCAIVETEKHTWTLLKTFDAWASQELVAGRGWKGILRDCGWVADTL